MVFPLRDVPEEDPSRTGWEGTAGAPAAAPAHPEAGRDAGPGMSADADAADADTADSDAAAADVAADRADADADTAKAGRYRYAGTHSADDDAGPATGAAEMAGAEMADAERVVYAPPPSSFGIPAATSTPADAGSPMADTEAGEKWRQILAMFVDDPRSSVVEAAELADDAISALIAAVRAEQASLASSWQHQEAGTEELRLTLQEYRAFWRSVTRLSLSA